jgi:hypothetical protein
MSNVADHDPGPTREDVERAIESDRALINAVRESLRGASGARRRARRSRIVNMAGASVDSLICVVRGGRAHRGE